jgi:hypothetical protein
MAECHRCGGEVERAFRYCPWCAAPQRLKLTEFFRADPKIEGPRVRALRVSRYLGASQEERHVRFSVWTGAGEEDTRVEAAVSLDESEAERLSHFLRDPPAVEAADTEAEEQSTNH